MKKSQILFIGVILFIGIKASAQNSPVPDGYSLKAKEDYAKYEPDFVKTVDWLQQASWNEPVDNRKPANAFVIAWISGSPTINVAIGEALMKLTNKNPELLVIYMGQNAKYSIQHKDNPSADAANIAAVRAMVEKYTAETARKKDSAMEKLSDLDKDGKLDDWVKTNFTDAAKK
jgi:hypothetical protein